MSGRDALGVIQRSIEEERARSRAVEAQLEAASTSLVETDQARARALGELATIRVGWLAEGGLADRLNEADRRALTLLERRVSLRTAVEGELADAEAERVSRASARRDAVATLERAVERLDEAEAATQARLAEDPGYLALREAAEAAERVAVHADEKATLAEEERAAKGAAYDGDPLFAYLWRRGYGTTTYRGWPLTRWLDGRVARLIGFEQARRNYHRLQELPVRLREHADRVGAAADEALAALAERDADEREADGVLPLADAVEAARVHLLELDAEIERSAAAVAAVEGRLAAFARGEDPLYLEAVALLTEELGRVSLQALAREAIATPLPEDDRVVARLLELERRRETQTMAQAELREAAARHKARATDLERVRIDFTRRRYDQPGNVFTEGALIGTLLAQLLDGVMTRDALWRVLERQRRVAPTRSDPTFGSGGFGRGSPWGGGLGGGSGGGKSVSFGGTKRAGGFKTGGSIGGGGFKTGGRMGGGGFKSGGKF
ncbi:MAG: hypothetical protein K0A98_10475 [Trueperaceae bacterium]|nr:hypothetical protein [Trueperaceae bacterium]